MSIEGQRLGEFEILECLGQGGMGAVYKARQITLDRFVALKTLQAAIAADPEYIARFRREAKAAAGLNHPNLVQVYSAGETEGLHWFAMEFVEGESAQMRLRRKGRLEPTEAIAIATHVATALDYAWRKAQLIHRDIKPDNIFLSSDGEVKLGDLGLAKSAGETQSLTATGSSMGTPYYVSPEQVEGKKDVDLRADIYSLGCTLFHVLSGQAPYSAETAVATMLRHVTAPVPNIRHVWPACPKELARVVMKMMLKPPAARQQSYGELIADLRGAYDSLTAEIMPDLVAMTQAPAGRHPAAAKPETARPGQKPRPVGALAGGSLLLLAAVAVLCYFAPWKSKTPPAEARPAADAPIIPVADGAWQDLLAGINLPGDIRDSATYLLKRPSHWELNGGSLRLTSGRGSIVVTPAMVGPNYDVEFRLTRALGAYDAVVGLPVAGRNVLWTTLNKAPCGFEKIGNTDILTGPASVPNPFADGQQHRVLLSVRTLADGQVSLHSTIDGQPSAEWTGPASQLGVHASWEHQPKDRLCLGASGSLTGEEADVVFSDVRFRPIAVDAVLPTGVPQASSSPSIATATKEAPFANSLGMKFVPVPGTKVLFSIWDTRVRDYATYAKENKVDGSWQTQQKDGVPVSREPEYPVVGVSWEDTQAFCQWLTEKETREGKLTKGAMYRLPTDEEWSIAVGLPSEQGATPTEKNGKNTVDYPWGVGFPPKGKVGNYRDAAFYAKFPNEKVTENVPYTDGFATSSPVGSFPANAFGLYDMGGNVWQWCADWYDATQKDRVLRGACWDNMDRYNLRSSNRKHSAPTPRLNYGYGFRCVLDPAPAVAPAVVPAVVTPAAATKDAAYVNTLGMKFVPVPGTKVLFSIWDTRVRDYAAFAEAKKVDGSWKTQEWGGVPVGREADHPVVGVSWEEAQGFCQWLTEKEIAKGKLPTGMKYRLPSDEEWSRAVGLPPESGATPAEKSGKNNVDFPWGADYPPKGRVGNLEDEAFHAKFPPKNGMANPWMEGYDDGFATTSPVGSFPANGYGLYDMGGNVSQWCEDWFDASERDRVLRGASWHLHSRGYLLSSSRAHYTPSGRQYTCGFRCVLAPATSAAPARAASYPQPVMWIDVTAEVRKRYEASGKLVAEGEWLRGVQPGASFCDIAAGKIFRNCALRAVFSGRVDLVLALRRNPTNGDTRYGAGVVRSDASIEVDSRAGTRVIGPYVRLPAPLAEGEAHEAVFAAQGGKLTLWLDGKEISTAQDSSFDSGSLAILFKKDARGDSRVQKIEYAELPDSPAPAAPPQRATPAGVSPMPKANYPQPAQWIDATPDFRRRYAGKVDGLEAEGEWLRSATADGVRSIAPSQTFRNCVLRVAFSDRVDLALRRRPAEGDARYMGSIWTTAAKQAAIIAKVAPVWKPIIPTATSPVSLGQGIEREAVFAVQGDTLTLWLDGKQIAIAHDSSLASGSLAVEMTKGDPKGDSRIRKIEYGELPDSPAPAAFSTSGPSRSATPSSANKDKP